MQLRFVLALARGAGPGEAARSLGKTRQSAYYLRKRPGAEGFAAAWDAGLAFARTAAAAAHSCPAGFGGIETILVPRHYRGRLVGFVQREDKAGAMRLLGRLDRLAERLRDRPDLRGWSERLDALERATGFDSLDRISPANAPISSNPEEPQSPLDGFRGVSSPCARVRVKEARSP